jgi:hypothetical protein
MKTACVDPRYGAVQIKHVLDGCKLVYRYHKMEQRLIADVVTLLAESRCVAWYQGRLEFGFMALGNRSVASPFSPYVADNNQDHAMMTAMLCAKNIIAGTPNLRRVAGESRRRAPRGRRARRNGGAR